MVQLKQVSLRLKSIKNIQKITKTMKMVSASKFTKAERELEAARPFGYGPRKFYETSGLMKRAAEPQQGSKEQAPGAAAAAPPADVHQKEATAKLKKIFIAVTSDRGMCGAVHSGVSRRIRRELTELAQSPEASAVTKLVCLGDKSRSMLRPSFPTNMLITAKNIGRVAPVFADAAGTAAAVADAAFDYEFGEIYYNKYHTPVKYELSVIPFFTKSKIEAAPNINSFDDLDDEELTSYSEWTLAALLHYALKESAASEQSARMAAMDNATNNAADMIRKLTLLFNRTRQAVITRELIEIISGAAALK